MMTDHASNKNIAELYSDGSLDEVIALIEWGTEQPLTEGEIKNHPYIWQTVAQERVNGADAATNNGKQSANPHEGGSVLWWSWHIGYTNTKREIEQAKRRAH